MVDRAAVRERAERVDQDLELLDSVRSGDRDRYLGDRALQLQVERALEVSIQACIDIGAHLVAAWGIGPPEDYGDVFDRLALSGGLDRDLSGPMVAAARQRTMLLHVYLRIDHAKIWQKLDEIDDLRAFVRLAVERASPDE